MDTITLKYSQEQAGNISLLDTIPNYLTNPSIHHYDSGIYVSGNLSNLKVTVGAKGMKVNNSLTKYYLKDNIKEMRRSDTERAFEMLSDDLHLPLAEATVTSLHFAKNIIVKHDVNSYFPFLGGLSRYQRYISEHGINYKINSSEFATYDKIKELKHKREFIPPMYQNQNIMRLEQRYHKRFAERFNRPIITGKELYEEGLYMEILKDWYRTYKRIEKLQKSIIDMSQVTTKRELYLKGILALVTLQGGELTAIEQVNERYRKGELTKKQAHDLRQTYKESRKANLATIENELIVELDKKIKDSLAYYR